MITPKQFVDFALYNGLFDHVSLINHSDIEHWLQNIPDHESVYHLDDQHQLWSRQGWINELRRCKELDDASAQFKANYKAPEKKFSGGVTGLMERIHDAMEREDYVELAKLQQILKVIKS